MPETKIPKKKTTVRRTRRTISDKIDIKKHSSDEETIHVVNLKKPLISERAVEEPIFSIEPSQTATVAGHWSAKLYRKLAITFILIAVIALGIVAYFAAVKLEVVITPKVTPVSGNATFSIYDRPQDFTLPASSIFGIVRQMETEYTKAYPITGGKVTGAEVSGHVVIVNNYVKDQPLVATTRLLTPTNQLLRLKNSVVVPAGGSVETEVYGDSADPSFALADTKLTIPGLWAGLQDKIYAQAKAGDVSYKEKKENIVTQDDLDKAILDAKQALLDKATSDIETTYSNYDEKLYQLDDQSLTFSFDSKVGEKKSEIKITMSGKVMVVAFKKADLVNLNKTALEAGLQPGQSLLDDPTNKPTFKISSADATNNIASVELSIAGSATAKSGSDLVDKQKLVGLTKKQIESYLDGLPNIASYELHFSPAFLKIAPQLADRITIIVK